MKSETYRLIIKMFEFYSMKIAEAKVQVMEYQFKNFKAEVLEAAWMEFAARDVYGKMPTIAQLLQHVKDGRPSAHEAWAQIPRDEADSTYWTQEMRIAYGEVRQVMDEKQNAWFSFKEKYEELVLQARTKGDPVKWEQSFGHDKSGRELAIKEAIEKNRLLPVQAIKQFPELCENLVTKYKMPQLMAVMPKQISYNKPTGNFGEVLSKALEGQNGNQKATGP
jgi:hypothetical protein